VRVRDRVAFEMERFRREVLHPAYEEIWDRVGRGRSYQVRVLDEAVPTEGGGDDSLLAALCADGALPARLLDGEVESAQTFAGDLLLVEESPLRLRSVPHGGRYLVAPIFRVGFAGEVAVHPRVAYYELARRGFRVVDERYDLGAGGAPAPIDDVGSAQVLAHFAHSFGSFRIRWWAAPAA
jgi:hypothetical protein